MNNRFHLAITVNDLDTSVDFYCRLLGCQLGDYEDGKWQDINFWGNELTLHISKTKTLRESHHVDMGNVCVPHFGVHLSSHIYMMILKKELSHSMIISILMNPTFDIRVSLESKKHFLLKIQVET